MKMIEAIVRTVSLEGIVKALEGIGIKGMTIWNRRAGTVI
jgi:nitrogen regulatory protein PII